MQSKFYNKNRPAFTLIEVLVSVTVISVLIIIISQFFVSSMVTYEKNKSRLDLTDQSLDAYNYLNDEIRSTSTVLACNPNDLTFTYVKGELDSAPLKISYSLNANDRTLVRSQILGVSNEDSWEYPDENAESKVISSEINNSDQTAIFTYYDSSSTLLASPCTPASVRMIGIDLRYKGTGHDSASEIETSTKIQLRNLKNNL
jgi:prepilin-type N-terminal cleavage/methylation domain-containing protein